MVILMSKLTNYIDKIDDAASKIKNNMDYFDSFGEMYIPQKLKDYLSNIYKEMDKVKTAINGDTLKK